MGVIFGKERGGGGGAELFVGVGFKGAHVDELDVLLLGDLLEEGRIAHVAFDVRLAVGAGGPNIADGQGEECRGGTFGPGFVDVFAEVPAEGVDGFRGSGEGAGGLGDGLGFIADAVEGASGFGAAEIAGVVVSHLKEEEVAGFHFGEDFVPAAFVEEGAGGTAGHGSVGDVDAGGVEEVGEVVAPAEVGSVAGGGVADDEDGGECGVEGRVGGEIGLDGGVGWSVWFGLLGLCEWSENEERGKGKASKQKQFRHGKKRTTARLGW